MSWRDREYARGTVYGASVAYGRGVGLLRGRSIVTTLIWINLIIFVLCLLTGGSQGVTGSPLFHALALYAPAVRRGAAWQIITAQYLHVDEMHILFNMIGLHFLGRPLEREWGTKQFLGVYTVAGLLGNLFLLTLTFAHYLPVAPAVGASGCILGLLGAAAVRYPHAEVWIYFLFPIKIRTAALIFGGLYLLNLYRRGQNAGGDACHLAGMVFGAWWAWRGEAWWFTQRRVPRFRVRTVRPTESPFGQRVGQRRADAETVDRILKKVYESGIHSLTEAEKTALREAT
ncbi:MAG: rhomboid family intramembrane serine protease, partial [Phycisphaerales bacterium]|nr:rhomboid family intramembrane serine protease [Phycisphaerales bacterium]